MKRSAALFLALLFLALPLFSGCGTALPAETGEADSGAAAVPTARPLGGGEDAPRGVISEAFVQSQAEMALSLFSEVYRADPKSVLLSPLSVSLALAMTANGAKGETKEELERFLAGGGEIGAFNEQLYTYVTSLSGSEDARLKAADSIWYNGSLITPAPSFLDLVRTYYAAEVRELDLARPEAADAINGWVKEKTDEMIPEILSEKDLGPTAAMVLVNALAFEAKWKKPAETTRDMTFTDEAGKTKTLPFFSSRENAYIRGEKETGFIKPYAGGTFAFLALLPDEGISLSDYLASLDGERYLALVNGSEDRAVDVTIPEFSTEFGCDLAETLPALGVKTVFGGNADLSALSADGKQDFSVSKVLHKTRIDMTKDGTKAAAATAVVLVKNAAPSPEKVPSVVLDRPFCYAIIDTATGLPIFFGCYEG